MWFDTETEPSHGCPGHPRKAEGTKAPSIPCHHAGLQQELQTLTINELLHPVSGLPTTLGGERK